MSHITLDSFISDIAARFTLAHDSVEWQLEKTHLEKEIVAFLKVEASPLKPSNFLKLISNAIASTYSSSDWALMRKNLKERGIEVLKHHFKRVESSNSLGLKADALAEFTLRFLVTRQAHAFPKLKIPRYIEDVEWEDQKMDTISIDDLIERSIHGNGFHLVDPPVADLLALVIAEKCQINNLMKRFEEFQQNKRFVNSLQNFIERSAGSSEIIQFVLNEIKLIPNELREFHDSLNWVDAVTAQTYTGRRQKLVQVLKETRLQRAEYQVVFKLLQDIITDLANNEVNDSALMVKIIRFVYGRLKKLVETGQKFLADNPRKEEVNTKLPVNQWDEITRSVTEATRLIEQHIVSTNNHASLLIYHLVDSMAVIGDLRRNLRL